jgi:hypothetical protein
MPMPMQLSHNLQMMDDLAEAAIDACICQPGHSHSHYHYSSPRNIVATLTDAIFSRLTPKQQQENAPTLKEIRAHSTQEEAQ